MKEFFPLHPDAFGLDVSDNSLKLCRLSRRKKGYSLASFVEVPLKEGVVEQGEVKEEEALSRAIAQALKHSKGAPLDTSYAVASLPEGKAFMQVIQLPAMKEEEVEQAIRFQAENFIPYPLETVVLDFQIISLPKASLDHLDVLVVSVPRSIAESYLAAMQKAKLVPLAFETESLAVSRAMIAHGVSPLATLMLDFGYLRTNFIVHAGLSVRFSVALPFSGARCTDEIAKALSVDRSKAETLKREHGIANTDGTPQGKETAKALMPLLSDFVSQLNNYISYYNSHPFHEHGQAGKTAIQRVLLCGGGSLLKGLAEFLSKELQLPIEQGNPWVNILPDPVDELPALSFHESVKYATALGLALRGVEKNTHGI
ncbi:MAG: type IV pilus assembly protein PilM [Candidatus Wildermuthbacteria bacterium]|nr:type IV pilus assembly protein PilM [Candidatus Wildermuthbacteria bacterium]